jgi:hypothetical protein
MTADKIIVEQCLDKTTVGKISIDKMTLDELTAGKRL